jgi:hypothetical protein
MIRINDSHAEDTKTRTPRFVIEEVNDPAEAARCQTQMERFRRNRDWLQTHWADFLPQARGKILAIAGQEGFVADTPAEAWEWVARTHPEDDGAFVRYVRAAQGPRVYANRR